MGTQITVTTPNPGDVAAIQPASGAPAAPFGAVLALMTPEGAIPSVAVTDAALTSVAGGLPTEATIVPSSSSVESLLPAVAIPPVQPVFSAMVNAADPAEADIAALMAATALATRGVAARAPEPVSPPVLPASPEAVVPDDFIGPVRPSELTADPAALVADNAAGLPEAAELVPSVMAADAAAIPADFIGPVLPADRRLRAVDIAPQPLPVDMLPIEAATSAAPLPEAQALLQPKIEAIDFGQPRDAMATPPTMMAESDHAAVHAEGFVLASGVSASAAMADRETAVATMDEQADKALIRATAATAHQKDDTSERAPAATRYELATAMLAVSQDAANVQSHDNQTASRGDDDSPAIASDASNDPARDVLMQQAAMAALQSVSQNPASVRSDDDQTAYLPQTPQPVARDPRIGSLPLTRDEALLRVMNEIAPAKSQPAAKTDRTVQIKAGSIGDLGVMIDQDDAADLASSNLREAGRAEADVTSALRHALARASTDRNDARNLAEIRTADHARDANAERAMIDPKIAAMVHNVTVTHGATDTASDAMAVAANVAPTPMMAPSAETIARDANVVASVNADGRRDTKRDAEIRQRQVEQQINLALRAGVPEIRMQLYPPGLGQIIIRLALDGQKLRLSMTADNDEAADTLAQTELGLRDALSRDGYTLAGFDVRDHGDKDRRQQSRAEVAPQPSTSPAEGDAFSVDMTA